MVKNDYLDELDISHTQKRNGPNNTISEVKKIQSWLTLYEYNHPASGTGTNVDGDFGPATKAAVKRYQNAIGKSPSGIVSKALFKTMVNPLEFAFLTPGSGGSLRDKICSIAMNHMVQRPKEISKGDLGNFGPWVRSYMNGRDGDVFWWCMGFVQTIIDQALSEYGIDFTTYLPKSELCDFVGEWARHPSRRYLITNEEWKNNPALVNKGDIFLERSARANKIWKHTGIIMNLNEEICQTIEGNTNEEGVPNGDGVYYKNRNYHNTKLDIISIQYIVDDI
ncbi:MAG: peptidoglycan-binding domain-containing protein [Saprospiraceae bacterium]|nr:peptidoglycan-binding domain-containing protein [Saprospiraceae bacterium]